MKTRTLSKAKSLCFIEALSHNFGDMKAEQYDFDSKSYLNVVFSDFLNRNPKPRFPTKISLISEIRASLNDYSYIFRFYSLVDDRQAQDPDHFYIPELLISVEIIPLANDHPSLKSSLIKEHLYAVFQKRSDYNILIQKEMKRDRTQPKYIIWEISDPRINGDYFSEVAESVYFIGYEDEAIDQYRQIKSLRRYAGSSHISYSYPQKIIGSIPKIGEKKIIHPAKEFNREEYAEIIAYESEDGDY